MLFSLLVALGLATSGEASLKTALNETGSGAKEPPLGEALEALIDSAADRARKLEKACLQKVGIAGMVGKFDGLR